MMRHICGIVCGLGWLGAIFLAPGLLERGAPIWAGLLVGAGSLAAAYIGGYYAGFLWDKPARRARANGR